MFRPWVVTSVLVALVLAGVAVSAVGAWMPPGPSEFAANSYSGRTIGYLGLYETLEELGLPVQRSWATPADVFRGNRRILLLQPELFLVEREKAYLADLQKWMNDGGDLVLVTRNLEFFKDNPDLKEAKDREKLEEVLGKDRLPAVLGVEGLSVASLYGPDEDDEPPAQFTGPISLAVQPDYDYEPSFDGVFAPLADSIKSLALPEDDLRWFEGDPVSAAAGKIEVENLDGDRVPVVLQFQRERGRLTLVSEPTLLNNIGLGKGDNAVLAYRLASSDDGREIVFDEYYHGALAELGPIALLGAHPFGAIAAFVLLATLLWVWSSIVRFGPPVPASEESRRSILEYVDAMARLFRRGRKAPFVLRVNREGFVDEIRRELRLPAGTPPAETLRRLARAEPERARRVEEALREVDQIIAAGSSLSEQQLVTLQERLETCRPRKAPKSVSKPSPKPMAS